MRRWPAALGIVAAVVGYTGCASQGMPPGGPPDREPPKLTKVLPESGTLGTTPRAVEFQFDEVVSERPRGAPTLGQLVVISPGDGEINVAWNRSRLVVRPGRGWKENTAYTVTVLAGLSDLRGNFSTGPFSTVFSTGRTIPTGVLRGAAFDWMAGRPAPGARIEASLRGDTAFKWSIAADSVGRFALGSLPADTFLVRGWIDVNRNGLRDRADPWDTTTLVVRDSARTDFYAFPRDTAGARLSEVTLADSVTVRIKFDHGLRPTLPLGGSLIRVIRARDSTELPIEGISTAAAYDSLSRARPASKQDSAAAADTSAAARQARLRADSLRRTRVQDSIVAAQLEDLRAARDTVRRDPPPVPARPTPPTEFVIVMRAPLPEDVPLRLIARDIQALEGPRRTSERALLRRKAPSRDTTATKRPPSMPPVVPPTRPPR
jgi:hypothetical protein